MKIYENKPMKLTELMKDTDVILLRGGRHNNVIADDTFMNDVRTIHIFKGKKEKNPIKRFIRKIRKQNHPTVECICQSYPDDRRSHITIHNVKNLEIESVYWSDAGFNWK